MFRKGQEVICMDVGVQSAYHLFGKYRPMSFEEIKNILDKREIKAVDHHT